MATLRRNRSGGHCRDRRDPAVILLVLAGLMPLGFGENITYAVFNSGPGETSTTLCHLGGITYDSVKNTPEKRQCYEINRRGERERDTGRNEESLRTVKVWAAQIQIRKTVKSGLKGCTHAPLSFFGKFFPAAPGGGFTPPA